MDKFLEDCGIKLNAIPENYTEEPPNDINLVKKNANILKSLLSVNVLELEFLQFLFNLSQLFFPKGPYQKTVLDLMERILSEIYQKVNSLIDDVTFTLQELSRLEYSYGAHESFLFSTLQEIICSLL